MIVSRKWLVYPSYLKFLFAAYLVSFFFFLNGLNDINIMKTDDAYIIILKDEEIKLLFESVNFWVCKSVILLLKRYRGLHVYCKVYISRLEPRIQ